MDEHLQALVLAQVYGGVLVDAFRLACSHVCDGHLHSLLVSLDKLWLCRVLLSADTRWQNVVDRGLVGILLNVHGTDNHLSGVACRVGKVLVVGAPFATDEVEIAETQNDRLGESGEEHTHEADAGEVADGTDLLLEVGQRNAELIPVGGLPVAVAEGLNVGMFLDDVVLTDDEVFRTDRDVVLIVTLIFVQRVVLVDVLNIRGCLV